MNIKEQFDEARKAWPGDKNGIDPEWDTLIKVCKQYKYKVSTIVPLLLPAIERYKVYCSTRRNRSEWVEAPAHFQTWLNQRRWLREHPAPRQVVDIEAQRAASKEKQRESTQWIKEQSCELLKTFLETCPNYEWLVRELRPEAFNA